METVANSNLMLILAVIVVGYFTVQSIFFINKAWRRGKQLGLTSKQMVKVSTNSVIVSIIPAISNVLLLATFIGALGSYFSWMRLSIVGSPVYLQMVTKETLSAYPSVGEFANLPANTNAYLSNVWVIAVGILAGLTFDVLFLQKFDKKLKASSGGKNGGFSQMAIACMFPTLMIVFVAPEVLNFSAGNTAKTVMNIVAMLFSLAITLLLYGLSKKTKKSVFKDFALPASLILSMVWAIVINLVIY